MLLLSSSQRLDIHACACLPFAYGIRCRGGRAAERADANWQTPGKSKAELGERDPGESGTNEGQHQTGRLGGSPALIRPCGPGSKQGWFSVQAAQGRHSSDWAWEAGCLFENGRCQAQDAPFPAGQKCTPKGHATTSNPMVLYRSIRSVQYSIMVDAQGRSPRPDSTRTPSGCGWQTGRLPEGANFAINGKIPLLPYFPRRSATCQRVRLHGYTATRDILILHVCSDGSFPHTASPVRILRLRAVCQWLALAAEEGEHRATAVKALYGRH